MKKILLVSAFCSSLLLASSEVDELKMQLQKQSNMIEALTQRLDEMQDTSHLTQNTPVYTEEDVPDFSAESIPSFEENTLGATVNSTSSFAQPQFVPNISLVIDTSLALRNKSQDELNHLGMPGIMESPFASGDDGHGHSAASGQNGFNFNYAELVFSSNVDPFFSLDATFHFSEDSVEIEEAYFTTTALTDGVRIKGGKFLSDFGRLNQQHQHTWNFSDAPLIYAGFLGNDRLNEVGVQLQYTLPTDTYLMVGVEALQGSNETSFGNQSVELNGQEVTGSSAPSMVVAYVKNSFDIGNTTVLPGASYVYGNSISSDEHDGHALAFSGHTGIYNLELTLKHYFDSYSFLAWQSEWMRREQDGAAYEVHLGVTESEDQKIRQEGVYSQVVYGVDQNWRTGVRYDSIYKNDVAFVNDDGDTFPSTPYSRYSVMAEYHFSEFSRLRLQYNLNKGLYSGDAHDGFTQEDVHELLLSFNFAIGAHNAHDF
ncbi:MAG: hypothetical protein COA44_05630 [Arcobacter sp.]|nr:MAG: hypothetical protein COA44_05630 [Arcobacter sp.]